MGSHLLSLVRDAWWLDFAFLGVALALTLLLLLFTGHRRGLALLPLAFLVCAASTLLLMDVGAARGRDYATPFVQGVALGCGALVITAWTARLEVLRSFRYLAILAALTLAVLLVAIGTGPRGTDAKINLFDVFQPAEYIKLLVVLFLASYFAARDVELRRLDAARWLGVSIPRWRDAMPVAVFVAAAIALFFLQKDLGPALVLYLLFLGLFVTASRRYVLGLGGLACILGAFWITYRFRLLQTVATRIEMWLSPWDNHRPGGVQLAESLWALASGGEWGSGLGRADTRLIPAGHTDLALASAGETFGLAGVAVPLILYVCVLGLMVWYSWRARSAFDRYLGFGLTWLIGIQAALMAGATMGLLPLTGVPLPFMSYGKSATIAHFIVLGLMLRVAERGPRDDQAPAAATHRTSLVALVVSLVILGGIGAAGWRGTRLMTIDADVVLVRGALTPQADGVRRYSYNRRLLNFATRVSRGSVLDRNGLALATNEDARLEEARAAAVTLGVEPSAIPEGREGRRRYPFGRYAAQVVGHLNAYWADPRTVEREAGVKLRGYPYDEDVTIVDGRRVLKRDFSGLVPAFRARFAGPGGVLDALLARDRDVRLTLDARLQVAALQALERNLPVVAGVARSRGAAAAIDAQTGEVLALVSLPTYDPNAMAPDDLDAIFGADSKAALDRARFEVYPPGSTFKLVTASAAIEAGILNQPDEVRTSTCHHADEIAWVYEGRSHRRRVTDDEAQGAHGSIDVRRAIVESCNVHFGRVGLWTGPDALLDMARGKYGLALKDVPGKSVMGDYLADHAYGQARITVTPMEMATVVAAIANGGRRVAPMLFLQPSPVRLKPDTTPVSVASGFSRTEPILTTATADFLRDAMIDVVRVGTGRRAAVDGLVVGGKTGTAETESGDGVSHSWFVGFAYPPEDGPEKAIAFAFLIENGGYGGRAAAGAARDFLSAWRNVLEGDQR